ncbi:MAG: DNA-processing protein DprA [Defluviitaleaceae bacterium]|nr:DNA-processing protein DprA [Defluviitaleaceae bacterium]
MNDDIYMLWLSSLVPQFGSRKLNGLLEEFGAARNIFHATHSELRFCKLTALQLSAITAQRDFGYIEALLACMNELGMAYLARGNERFPGLLAEIPDPPLGIFFIGELPPDNTNRVAIIGSRKCSEYGLMSAQVIAKPLAAAGVVIVSGMAHGVDSMAHKGALEGGGKTIAVLGCGADICYPSQNKKLRDEIIKNGCVLSEYPPGTRPIPAYFPARNRIISGLSQGVVVTEASKKSGTLITVDQAIEQGREVLAVPGNISSRLSTGTNSLIRDGAFPVMDYTDVLYALKIDHKEEPITKNQGHNLAPDEKQVYDNLTFDAISFDMLHNVTGINPGQLHLICMGLELKGLARKLPGARYIKGV